MPRKFKVATAAGTFDYFHKGHEEFLLAAFKLADTIYIGITSNEFGKAKRQVNDLAPFVDRKRDVESFLRQYGLKNRTHIVELHDIYGPTLDPDCPIEAIIVTEKTHYGAKLINKLRKKKGLAAFEVVNVAYVKAADNGDFSSSRIRMGEIDRAGNLYIKEAWFKKTLTLPDDIRPILQRPIGMLIKGSEENLNEAVAVIKQKIHPRGVFLLTPQGWRVKIITVGDIVTKSFNEGNLPMDIAIVDYRVKREERFKNVKDLGFKKDEPDLTVENPKGTLTGKLFQTVQEAIRFIAPRGWPNGLPQGGRSPFIIRIIGEEDLATLPVILAAPLGTHVFYGQPSEGVVDVSVTEEKKSETRNLASQFR